MARLGAAGAIEEVSPGTFRALKEERSSTIELSRESFDRAVTRYHDEFAADVVKVLGSWPMRAAAALVPHDMADLDATRLSFLFARLVDRAGAKLGDLIQRDPLVFPIAGSIVGEERARLLRSARQAMTDINLASRDVRFRFDDGDEEQLGRR